MPSLSPVEIAVVAVLALIVFGPQKLPEIARTVGRALNELKKQANELKAEFQDGMSFDDQPEPDEAKEPPSTTEVISAKDEPSDEKPSDSNENKPEDG
jgi:TatA/E family protein of Tat protein translocase